MVENPKQEAGNGRKALKWIGIGLLAIFGLLLWYFAIPLLVIWYLYKKDRRLSSQAKLLTSIVVSVVFFSIGGVIFYRDRAPSLIITEPQNSVTVQSKTVTVKGNVSPRDTSITINSAPVIADTQGNFSYDAVIPFDHNTLHIVAKRDNNKQVEKVLEVTRVFTQEEIAEKERKAVEDASTTKQMAEEFAAKQKADDVTRAKARLQKELDSFDKPFDSSSFRSNVTALQVEIALFLAWGQIVAEYKGYPDSEVQAMAAELERKASQLQVKEFPILRKTYAKLIGNELWESDIDVTTLGGSNKTIEFTGAMFASNKNIAEAQRTLHDALVTFRFTRANYKWYEDASEYEQATIDSQPDGKVVWSSQ